MPKRFEWSLERFYNGFTGSTLQDKEVFASDMSNLKSDDYGNLITRYAYSYLHDDQNVIEGFSVRYRGKDPVIMFLNAADDLKLYSPTGSVVLVNDPDFSGKLTSAFVVKNAMVVTTSGPDRGYWINLTNYLNLSTPNAEAHPLGIAPPDVSAVVKNEVTGGSMSSEKYYYYRFSYFREVGDTEPFDDMESELTDAQEVRVMSTQTLTVDTGAEEPSIGDSILDTISSATGIVHDFVNTGGDWGVGTGTGTVVVSDITGVFGLNTCDNTTTTTTSVFNITVTPAVVTATAVQFTVLPVNPTDTQIKRLKIYRSKQKAAPFAGVAAANGTEYYLVATISTADSSYLDVSDDATIDANGQFTDINTRLPTTLKAVEVYRDMIWGACGDELRYSDIVDGAPVYWRFPEANNIRVNGEILFVKKYRDTLFFGGPQGVWRLTGSTKYDFVVEQISTVGPLNSYTIEQDDSFLWFIGVNWLYGCNGAEVEPLHPELRPLFRDIQVKDGSVIPLPNGEILFTANIATVAGTDIPMTLVRKPDGGWEKWQGTNIRQGAPVITTSLVTDQKSIDVYFVDESGTEIREILWDRTDVNADISSSGNTDIAWFWKSQRIDGETSRVKNMTKAFADIEIDVDVTMAVRLNVWVDDVWIISADVTVTRNVFSPWRYPVGRRGRMIQFQIIGTKGPVEIRGFKIIGSLL